MNLRTVKKDVDYMVNQVILEAFVAFHLTEEQKQQEEIVKVMNEAAILREDTFDLINHPDAEMKARKYFRHVMKAFFTSIDKLIDKLDEFNN